MLNRLTTSLNDIIGGDQGEPVQRAEYPWEDIEEETGEHVQRIAGTAVLPEDTFASHGFSQDSDGSLEVELDTNGTGAIELFVVPEDFMEAFEKGENWASVGEASRSDLTSTDYVVNLDNTEDGDPHVVFDNTNRGHTLSSGEVEVEFEIDLVQ